MHCRLNQGNVMKFLTLGLAASFAALVCAGPAWSQESSAQTAASQSIGVGGQPADPKDTIVCKNLPPPTGSMIGGRRVCATQAQWESQARTTEDEVQTAVHESRQMGGSH
jgi:hypothetical protein